MLKLEPFLLFEGNCADAMTFYRSCLGGELTIVKIGDTGMKAQVPSDRHDQVAFARLEAGNVELSATDWQHPTRRFHPGNTVGLYLTGDETGALKSAFERLSVGADLALLDPLADLPFGLYGHLCDAYGVHWFFRAARER